MATNPARKVIKRPVTYPCPIFLGSISNLAIPLRSITGWPDVTVVSDTANTGLDEVGDVKGKVEYPIIQLQLSSVGPRDQGGLNRIALKKTGVRGVSPRISEDGNFHYFFQLVEVKAEMTLTLITNKSSDIYDFIQGWLVNTHLARFEIGMYGSGFPIILELSPEISIPEANIDSDDKLELVTTFGVNTFIGEAIKVPTSSKVKFRVIDINSAYTNCPDDVTPMTVEDITTQ